MEDFKPTDSLYTGVLTNQIRNKLIEAQSDEKKYNRDSLFNVRKMSILVKNNPNLYKKYEKLFNTYKDKLSYHYNENILAIIFIYSVINNDKLFKEYQDIVPSGDEDTVVIRRSVEETTTASSSGQYTAPATFLKQTGHVKSRGKYNPYTQVAYSPINYVEKDIMSEMDLNKFCDGILKEANLGVAANTVLKRVHNSNKDNFNKDMSNSNTTTVRRDKNKYYNTKFPDGKDTIKPEDLKKFGNTSATDKDLKDKNVDYARGMQSVVYDHTDDDRRTKFIDDQLEKNLGKISGVDGKKALENEKERIEKFKEYRKQTNTRNMLKSIGENVKLTLSMLKENGTVKDNKTYIQEHTDNIEIITDKEMLKECIKLNLEVTDNPYNKITPKYDFIMKENKVYAVEKGFDTTKEHKDAFNKLINFKYKQ